MAKKRKSDKWELEPQKSSAAQFITYIASTGQSSEKYEAAALVGREFVHFKGGHYRLHGFAKDSETLETMVVYEALYGENPLPNDFGVTQGGPWVRPAKMFFENVEKSGYSGPRFKLLETEKE